MYISSKQRAALSKRLFDTYIKMKQQQETKIKAYEAAFHKVIKSVFPDCDSQDVTSCDILKHLVEHRRPKKTIIAILKGLKEEE